MGGPRILCSMCCDFELGKALFFTCGNLDCQHLGSSEGGCDCDDIDIDSDCEQAAAQTSPWFCEGCLNALHRSRKPACNAYTGVMEVCNILREAKIIPSEALQAALENLQSVPRRFIYSGDSSDVWRVVATAAENVLRELIVQHTKTDRRLSPLQRDDILCARWAVQKTIDIARAACGEGRSTIVATTVVKINNDTSKGRKRDRRDNTHDHTAVVRDEILADDVAEMTTALKRLRTTEPATAALSQRRKRGRGVPVTIPILGGLFKRKRSV